MNGRNIVYWLTTGVFCLVLTFAGVTHLMHIPFMVEKMIHLGYPEYFMTIIGGFEFLGVVVVLAPGLPMLKEWAYAGFVFTLIGATASHFYSGEAFGPSVRPLVVLGFTVASYALRSPSRRLAESPSLAESEAS